MGRFNDSIIKNFPKSVNDALQIIVESLKPKKLILFGSRARGSERPNSDFDICAVGATKDQNQRVQLGVRLEEEPISLHKIDLLYFEDLNEDYLGNIKRDGRVIYE